MSYDSQNDPRGDFFELKNNLFNTIGSIQNLPLYRLLCDIFSGETLRKYLVAPGSRAENPGHHAFKGGLAYHSITVAKLGREIANHYINLGMKVDVDLVVAGLLLHDIGKCHSYEWCEGPEKMMYHGKEVTVEKAYKHTIDGKMLHHIPIGYGMFLKAVDEYEKESPGFCTENSDLIRSLSHIILSHHGRRSWSSPVIPQNLEAYIVHAVEMMDAYVDKYNKGNDVKTIYGD